MSVSDLILEITLCLGHLSSLNIKYHSTSLGSDSWKSTVSVGKHDKITISTSFWDLWSYIFKWQAANGLGTAIWIYTQPVEQGQSRWLLWAEAEEEPIPTIGCLSSSTSVLGSQGGTLAWICRHAKEWSLSPEKLPAINYSNSKCPSPIMELRVISEMSLERQMRGWENMTAYYGFIT